MSVAALFVETGGVYFNLDGVDPWDEKRDARTYRGPHPVVAHPPCNKWGKYVSRDELGNDGGCFEAAIMSVRRFGGVLEHPAYSKAWPTFGLRPPKMGKGWNSADCYGHTCYVEQAHYGHAARKPTWLYAVRATLQDLHFERAPQRLHAHIVRKYGYETARRWGIIQMIGGHDKSIMRARTPVEFRDLLLSLARSVLKTHE
jgi:hypothetical protein